MVYLMNLKQFVRRSCQCLDSQYSDIKLRIRELDAEIAQHERNQREGEARLPIEEQLSLKLRRYIEANLSELAGRIKITSEA